MATRSGTGTSNILCRYYANGCCNKTNCSFSHDRSARSDMTCRYYLQGNCFYGSGCRYDHIRPERANNNRPSVNTLVSGRASYTPPKPSSSVERQSTQDPSQSRVVPVSYAQAVDLQATPASAKAVDQYEFYLQVCQYAMTGVCQVAECPNWHGDVCEMCGCQVLDPNDQSQRQTHEKECSEALEADMHYSFALQHSKEITCSICYEVTLDQPKVEKRKFGILESCQHPHCFDCIMTWRKQSKEVMEAETLRSCPDCRVHSNYVIPSSIWPGNEQEKEKIIQDFKKAMSKKPCKLFNQGKGKCPFGSKCWYAHTLKDGTKVELPDPSSKRRVFKDTIGSFFLDEHSFHEFLEGFDEDEEEDDYLSDEADLEDEYFYYASPDWQGDTDDSGDDDYEISRAVLEAQRASAVEQATEDISALFEEPTGSSV